MDKPLGIILYGYDESAASVVQSVCAKAAGCEVALIGASEADGSTVKQILAPSFEPSFAERETKILMFINFAGEQIQAVLGAFPDDVLSRPIFCGLTNDNINWQMGQLVEHLQEEQARWHNG